MSWDCRPSWTPASAATWFVLSQRIYATVTGWRSRRRSMPRTTLATIATTTRTSCRRRGWGTRPGWGRRSARPTEDRRRDRESGEEGKRVSRLVDLVCRRRVKNKTHTNDRIYVE